MRFLLLLSKLHNFAESRNERVAVRRKRVQEAVISMMTVEGIIEDAEATRLLGLDFGSFIEALLDFIAEHPEIIQLLLSLIALL